MNQRPRGQFEAPILFANPRCQGPGLGWFLVCVTPPQAGLGLGAASPCPTVSPGGTGDARRPSSRVLWGARAAGRSAPSLSPPLAFPPGPVASRAVVPSVPFAAGLQSAPINPLLSQERGFPGSAIPRRSVLARPLCRPSPSIAIHRHPQLCRRFCL